MPGKTLSARPRSQPVEEPASEAPAAPAAAPAPAAVAASTPPAVASGAPSGRGQQNLQDVFLNQLRRGKVPVTMFLVKGVKLQGIVTWFDNFSILLRRDGQSQLVYKHAISTIMPGSPVQLFDQVDEAAEKV